MTDDVLQKDDHARRDVHRLENGTNCVLQGGEMVEDNLFRCPIVWGPPGGIHLEGDTLQHRSVGQEGC